MWLIGVPGLGSSKGLQGEAARDTRLLQFQFTIVCNYKLMITHRQRARGDAAVGNAHGLDASPFVRSRPCARGLRIGRGAARARGRKRPVVLASGVVKLPHQQAQTPGRPPRPSVRDYQKDNNGDGRAGWKL